MEDLKRGDWIDLGALAELPEGRATLRKVDAQRFVCVRHGDQVHALDDRCPHQGYPLSQGRVDGCTLVCQWHNWIFDLRTGECTFGGEPVRRYPTLVQGGRVLLDRAVDPASEAARLEVGLRAAFVDDDPARALREGLRLGALRPGRGAFTTLAAAFEVLAADGAERAEYGFDHGLAALADLLAWVERGWLPAEEAFVVAVTAVCEPSRHLGRREADPPLAVATDDRAARLAFLTGGLHDYGHGAIFAAKADELARRFPAAAPALARALAANLGWATDELVLPPFTATRRALEGVDALAHASVELRPLDALEAAAHVDALLAGEREALDATLAALARGVPARALLLLTARAAAHRVIRFDPAWEARVDAEVSVLDITHTVTFAEAALILVDGAPEPAARRLAVIAAGFVGKLRRGDVAAPRAPSPRTGDLVDLVAAVHARDVDRARDVASSLDPEARRAAVPALAPFLAFEMAVRPIFVAHGVKMGEALHRLGLADPEAAPLYLDALLAFAAPRRAERRPRRVAHVARQFLADGRPPVGLY